MSNSGGDEDFTISSSFQECISGSLCSHDEKKDTRKVIVTKVPVTAVAKAHEIEDAVAFDSVTSTNSNESVNSRPFYKPPVKEKTCEVCGDAAVGFNFNAISCESCKAFFRRSAGRIYNGRCEGNCDISIETRSYCKKCRLKKCFAVGMRREMILTVEQKKIRKQIINSNKRRRMGLQEDSDESEENFMSDWKDKSEVFSFSRRRPILPEVNSSEQEKKVYALSGKEAIDQLNKESKSFMDEVVNAFHVSFDIPIEEGKCCPTPRNNVDFLNMADTSIHRLIKMAKLLQPFQALTENDQICLLKGSVVEVLIFRSVKMFDISKMGWNLEMLSFSNSANLVFPTKSSSCPTNTMHDIDRCSLENQGGQDQGCSSSFAAGSLSDKSPGSKMQQSMQQRIAHFVAMNERTKVSKSEISSTGEVCSERSDTFVPSAGMLGNPESIAFFQSYMKFAQSLMNMTSDNVVIMLLIVMTLHSPDRSGISNFLQISHIQESYAYILHEYLMLKYGAPKGGIMFANAVQKLVDIRELDVQHSRMLMQTSIDELGPLILEIFDLSK